ncbi:MAG TPA: ATP-dependent helicase C-terminal domain-containing protein, partial [Gemmatimonadales bacterium]
DWRRRLGARDDTGAPYEVEAAGMLLALAYPDRVAQRRPGGGARFLMRNGRGAVLDEAQPLAARQWIVAAELDGRQRESRIFLAAPIALDEIESLFADQVTRETRVEWDDDAGLVRAAGRERLGAIVLRERAIVDPPPGLVTGALLDAIRARGLGSLPWTTESRRTLERLRFARVQDESWPEVSDAMLLDTLDGWLGAHVAGMRRLEEVRRVELSEALRGLLTWEQRARLDELAPTHVTVPTGSRIAVDYSDPDAPVLAVRLQELFGLAETPRVWHGRVPLTLHLLSPAHRPVQVTRDLAGFWRTSYFDVRRDLRGRYPRHHWPEDPMSAEPTRRAKKRGE